jgi:hypothetical protein
MDVRLNWDVFYFAWAPGELTGLGFGFILSPPLISFNTGMMSGLKDRNGQASV